jgi:hypothetical protein
MQHVAHSDWMFDHSLGHSPHSSADPHAGTSTDTSQVTQQSTQTDSAASVAQALWHQADGSIGGGSSATQGSSGSGSINAGSSTASPALTVTNNALTVNAGGSVALPISVSPANAHTSVTISGLTNYETVTDQLDGKTFTPDAHGSITLSAAEVNSGLSLASNYTGTDHPVNTLTMTAAETFDHHTLTSAAQTITVTDPPASTGTSGSSTSSGSNTLTLQVSGDQYNGDPQFEVFVDGHQVGGTYTVTADHASGQTQTITITGNFDPTQAHQVQVQFVNDAWDGTSWWSNGGSADGHDRNLYVESISLNGQTLNGSQGTDAANPGGGATDSNPNEAPMYTNGTLTFNVSDPPATTSAATTGTSGTSSTTTSGSSATTSSGTSASGDPSTGAADPAQTTNAFYVSPNGNDSNPGTLAAPFATLARAQEAMEGSSIKTTYLEGGTYNLTSTLTLTGADSGETWQYYAPDGVNSAVLDGTNGGNYINAISLSGVSNLTIDGIKIQNGDTADIYTPGNAQLSGLTIENCDLGFTHADTYTSNGAILIDNSINMTIKNNYIHDTFGNGMAFYAYNPGDSLDGSVISGNVVLRSVQVLGDNGAIYFEMPSTGTSGGHVTVSDNFIRDQGSANLLNASGTDIVGIYLDGDTSNATVTGNIIGPPIMVKSSNANNTAAIFVNGGSNNVFTGNIIDLGTSSMVEVVNWNNDAGVPAGTNSSGSVFAHNIVIADFSGNENTTSSGVDGYAFFQQNKPLPSYFTIRDNLYYNYGGGTTPNNAQVVSDRNPIVADPQLSGIAYALAASSPAWSPPVSFPGIVGGWGPPGFRLQNGTPPSHRH